MKINKQILNGLLDAILLIVFLLDFFMDITGLEIHQWLGLLAGMGVFVHLIFHWKWVETVTLKFFGSTSNRSRLYYLLDGMIFMGLGLILLTGIIISSWLNLNLSIYPFWKDLHVFGSIATLIMVVVKIGLHWKWIISTFQKIIKSRPAIKKVPGVALPTLQPVPVTNSINRRQFMVLMGVVGAAATLAVSNVLVENEEVSANTLTEDTKNSSVNNIYQNQVPSTTSKQVVEVVPTKTATTAAAATSNTSCVIQCNKRCSYPGRCRRYVDTNGNNLCDRGECL